MSCSAAFFGWWLRVVDFSVWPGVEAHGPDAPATERGERAAKPEKRPPQQPAQPPVRQLLGPKLGNDTKPPPRTGIPYFPYSPEQWPVQWVLRTIAQ